MDNLNHSEYRCYACGAVGNFRITCGTGFDFVDGSDPQVVVEDSAWDGNSSMRCTSCNEWGEVDDFFYEVEDGEDEPDEEEEDGWGEDEEDVDQVHEDDHAPDPAPPPHPQPAAEPVPVSNTPQSDFEKQVDAMGKYFDKESKIKVKVEHPLEPLGELHLRKRPGADKWMYTLPPKDRKIWALLWDHDQRTWGSTPEDIEEEQVVFKGRWMRNPNSLDLHGGNWVMDSRCHGEVDSDEKTYIVAWREVGVSDEEPDRPEGIYGLDQGANIMDILSREIKSLMEKNGTGEVVETRRVRGWMFSLGLGSTTLSAEALEEALTEEDMIPDNRIIELLDIRLKQLEETVCSVS